MEQESSIRHLTGILEDMRKNFESVSRDCDRVMGENYTLRERIVQLESDLVARDNHLENLLSFIAELEGNNKELMRFIDNKNMQTANAYKSNVSNLLNGRRSDKGAILRNNDQKVLKENFDSNTSQAPAEAYK